MPTYTGTNGNDQGTGLYDRLYGLGGNDRLISQWDGRVYLDGGDGDDILRSYGDGWGEFLGGAGSDWIGGGSTLNGDTILGGAGDDVVFGDGQDPSDGGGDVLDGGDGRDALSGDLGNDTISGGEGDDSGPDMRAGEFGFLYRRGLFGKDGDDHLDGGSGNDHLEGGEDDDTLVGGSGSDTMIGGRGDDIFLVESAGDLVIARNPDDLDAGWDTVISSVDFTLGPRLSHLILTGAARTGTGNGTSNKIVGNGLSNTLSGREGFDTLSGGDGHDRLSGGGLWDRLLGGAGNDTLIGGLERDIMTGGPGADAFVFDDRHSSIWVYGSKPSTDTITDFSYRAGDRIDLRAVDGNALASGDQTMEFIGTAHFTGVGQVRYEKSAWYTYLFYNTNADGFPEGGIRLKGSFDPGPGWFVF